MELSSYDFLKLLSLNHIFIQDLLFISSIEASLILLLVYRNGILFSSSFQIDRLLFLLSFDYHYLYYIIFITKTFYSFPLYSFLITFLTFLGMLTFSSCYSLWSLFWFKDLLFAFLLILSPLEGCGDRSQIIWESRWGTAVNSYKLDWWIYWREWSVNW